MHSHSPGSPLYPGPLLRREGPCDGTPSHRTWAECPSLSTWLAMQQLEGHRTASRRVTKTGGGSLLPSTISPALKDSSGWEAEKQRVFQWLLTQDPSRFCGVMSVVLLDECPVKTTLRVADITKLKPSSGKAPPHRAKCTLTLLPATPGLSGFWNRALPPDSTLSPPQK